MEFRRVLFRSYAKSFGTGKNHPYLWGGFSPTNGWDCSGFSAYVYEHFGYFPGKDKSRYGDAGEQMNSPLVQKSGAVPGALVFFEAGPKGPGHVGIVLNKDSYVGADSTS